MEERNSSTTSQTSTAGAVSRAGADLVGRVRDRASQEVNAQKERATDGLGSIAQAARQSTEQLRAEHHDQAASAVEAAADQLDRLAGTLRGKDASEFYDDAQRFARERPALFLGASFAVGFAAARFLKSAPPEHERWQSATSPGSAFGSVER